MAERVLDPVELAFDFITPSPWISPNHSYVTVRSADAPDLPCLLTSAVNQNTVTLSTTNVRSLTLDGAALAERGIETIFVDEKPLPVVADDMPVGPQDGKKPTVHGPLNQVWHQPFCYVYPDEGPDVYRRYASFLLSQWMITGNGHGCALPISRLTEELRQERNLIYLGIGPDHMALPDSIPFSWNAEEIQVSDQSFTDAAIAFTFPEGERLSAVFATTAGSEYLLFRIQPYTSRFVIPDYLVWRPDGVATTGFFDASWAYTSTWQAP